MCVCVNRVVVGGAGGGTDLDRRGGGGRRRRRRRLGCDTFARRFLTEAATVITQKRTAGRLVRLWRREHTRT